MSFVDKVNRWLGAQDAIPYLMPDEHVVKTYDMKAVVGLDAAVAWARRPADEVGPLGVAGDIDKMFRLYQYEDVGGILSLTNYRLMFAAHRLNIHHGHFSVFLPTLESVTSEAIRYGNNDPLSCLPLVVEFVPSL